MDEEPEVRVTINVKSVSEKSWFTAKKAANKQDISMGGWLSRAIETQARIEDSDLEFSSSDPVKNHEVLGNPLVDDLATLMQGMSALASGMAALSTATGQPPNKTQVRQIYGRMAEVAGIVKRVGAVQGKPARLTSGKALPKFGKSLA